ncbi:MAG: nucleotidyltransferase domain-containing protein [Ktedonobacteraceae bacterium]|nr:nucleotidyltransferase domain-containing protein [Ktedonobacteraceae bacterium]
MDDIAAAIKQALSAIETQEQVRILYACESGSRAWGFASHDSDYDVRFLYVRSQDAYLRVDVPRDVIERPIVDDLDINGWDIFKALRLLRKSNPPLLEWLLSPIIYREGSASIAELRTLARHFYSPAALYYHYSRMTEGNYRQYLQEKTEVILKKYLYTIRPLIALLFLEQQGQLPPTNFLETLLQVQLPEEVRAHIHALIARKQSGAELGLGAPDTVLNAFIEERLNAWGKHTFSVPEQAKITQELDNVLQRIFTEKETR